MKLINILAVAILASIALAAPTVERSTPTTITITDGDYAFLDGGLFAINAGHQILDSIVWNDAGEIEYRVEAGTEYTVDAFEILKGGKREHIRVVVPAYVEPEDPAPTLDDYTYELLRSQRAINKLVDSGAVDFFEVTASMQRAETKFNGELGQIDDTPGEIIVTPINVFAWKKDPAVTFANLHENIIVDPRSWGDDLTGANNAADDAISQINALHADGKLASIRYWKEFDIDTETYPRLLDNGNRWWDELSAFEVPVLNPTAVTWWNNFNARIIASGVTVDLAIFDFEDGDFWSIPSGERIAYFAAISIDDENNPWPTDELGPNPFIGASSLGGTSSDDQNRFIQAYRTWSLGKRSAILESISVGLAPAMPGGVFRCSNYKDIHEGFLIPDSQHHDLRGPINVVMSSNIASPSIYLSAKTGHSLTDPEPEYTTVRELENRRRFKYFNQQLNEARSAMSGGSEVIPWISYPGFGRNKDQSGNNINCTITQLPFEKLLWNHLQHHLLQMGVNEFIGWMPIVPHNPFAADTDAYMDAFFSDKVKGVPDRSISVIESDVDSVTTGSFTTNYSELMEITTLYYRRELVNPVPYVHGIGTQDDPLIISMGGAGDSELAAMLTAINENQDSTPSIQEVDMRSQIIAVVVVAGTLDEGFISAGLDVTGSFLFYVVSAATGARTDTDIVVNMTTEREGSAVSSSPTSAAAGDQVGVETVSASPDTNMRGSVRMSPVVIA